MASVGVLLHQLGWNSLQSRREVMRLCMLYKLYHGLVAADGMPQLIPMQWASRQLNSNAYEVPYSRTTGNYHKYSFFPCTIREWNLLPKDIVTLPNLDSFKKALHDHICLCFTYLFIFIYLLVYPFVICILLANLFIYLFIYLLLTTPHKNLHC